MSFLNRTEDGNRLTVSEEMNKLDYKKTRGYVRGYKYVWINSDSRQPTRPSNLHFNLLCAL